MPLTDCGELFNLGYKAAGTYWIDPTGNRDYQNLKRVYCDEGWTFILKRQSTGTPNVRIRQAAGLRDVAKCFLQILYIFFAPGNVVQIG